MLRVHKNSVPPGIFGFFNVDFQAGSNLKMVGTAQLIKFRYLLIIATLHRLRYCVNIHTYNRSISVKTSENQEGR